MPTFTLNSFLSSQAFAEGSDSSSWLFFGYTTNFKFLLTTVSISLVNWFTQYWFFVGHFAFVTNNSVCVVLEHCLDLRRHTERCRTVLPSLLGFLMGRDSESRNLIVIIGKRAHVQSFR